MPDPYGRGTLPPGIRSRMLPAINGLDIHILEVGFEGNRPALLLLHGFPELAYSWRKIMLPLADAGYHVIAPDIRGYGRTTGWDSAFDADDTPFRLTNLVRDAVVLLLAIGHRRVAAVLGHDAGSPIAAWAALMRPDMFRSAILLSTPFTGAPELPLNGVPPPVPTSVISLATDTALAALNPPRKHYIRWFAGAEADADLRDAPQGLHAALRAYYHMKSADWEGNTPHPLADGSAAQLGRIPDYYIMPRALGMAATVAPYMPSPDQVAACAWLTDDELAVYAQEYGRTGFSGGLWSYRRAVSAAPDPERLTHANRRINVPLCFISGARDWGTYQVAGALDAMAAACSQYRGAHLVPGAGHWVQQEQPDAVVALTLRFLADDSPTPSNGSL